MMSKSVSLLLAQLFLGWAVLLGVWSCSGDVGTAGQLATDLSHSMLVFSETQGRGTSRTFLLYNKGSGPLELSSLSLEGVDASRSHLQTKVDSLLRVVSGVGSCRWMRRKGKVSNPQMTQIHTDLQTACCCK